MGRAASETQLGLKVPRSHCKMGIWLPKIGPTLGGPAIRGNSACMGRAAQVPATGGRAARADVGLACLEQGQGARL